ncbi:MAG TPA: hypothetical protein VLQ93_04115 [Myxococcaceae bacterium]|nr:hypothetical protein [Myxococcaceae bacterium]
MRGPLGLVALVVLVGAVFLWMNRGGGEATASEREAEKQAAVGGSDADTGASRARSNSGSKPKPDAQAPVASGEKARPELIAELAWGSGPSELGRDRPEEANPEAPMSLAVDALGNIVMLDQVNGRLVRLDADGKAVGSFSTTQQAPQDVVVAGDGKLLVMDRLVDRTVAIMDPDTGRLLGELPVVGENIDDPGLVTGTFEYEGSVYVERDHGALVRIGDTTGQADTERPELPGRISRDGRFLLLTGLIERETGRIYLNVIDRQTSQHRYTREFNLQFPLWRIALLDTDLTGIIHLGVIGEVNPHGVTPAEQLGLRLYCIEPLEGRVLGQTELPISHLPEESFRDYQVQDEGGIVYQLRTEQGVSLRRASCH